jgi:hypothetical protein
MVWMLQIWNMKYLFKYNLSISCDKLFTINQHKFLVSCFFCSIFCKTKFIVNVHEKFHPFSFLSTFSSINIIHKYHSSMTCGRIFFRVTKYYVVGVIKYSLNILSMWEEYYKKIRSYSFVHVHAQRFMK